MEQNNVDELYLASLYFVKRKEYICYSMSRTISNFLDFAIVRKLDNKVCEDVFTNRQYKIDTSNDEGLVFASKNLICLNQLTDKKSLSYGDLYFLLNYKRKENKLKEKYEETKNIINSLRDDEINVFIDMFLESCSDNDCLIKEMFNKLESNFNEKNNIRIRK